MRTGNASGPQGFQTQICTLDPQKANDLKGIPNIKFAALKKITSEESSGTYNMYKKLEC